jgi:hypothetical protein
MPGMLVVKCVSSSCGGVWCLVFWCKTNKIDGEGGGVIFSAKNQGFFFPFVVLLNLFSTVEC